MVDSIGEHAHKFAYYCLGGVKRAPHKHLISDVWVVALCLGVRIIINTYSDTGFA